MAKVLCTRQNASEEINGVKFAATENGMLSEEISVEQAAAFCAIPGYALVAVAQASVDAGANDDGAVDLSELAARATELGVAVKSNWKAARLTAEIEKAEAEALAVEALAVQVKAEADAAASKTE